MNDFKIIAIRPLEGCANLKVLKANEFYYFYNDYKISDDGKTIEYKETCPPDLYNIKREGEDLKVNISAIVGKNGSGKSTIIELLIMAINNISIKISHTSIHLLYDVPQLKLELYINKGKEILKIIIKSKVRHREYNKLQSTHKIKDNSSKQIQIDIEVLIKDENNIYKLKNKNANIEILNEFIYSFFLNYSLYSLNSDHYAFQGDWLVQLFQKNDGYQIPIGLAPMRKRGNVDNIREDYLTKSRFMSNIIFSKNKFITEKQIAFKVKYTKYDNKTSIVGERGFENLNEEYLESIIKSILEGKNQKWNLLLNEFDITTSSLSSIPFISDIIIYIFKKLSQISRTYQEYIVFSTNDHFKENPGLKMSFMESTTAKDKTKINDKDNYFEVLSKDKSHITLKLRQALNYLKEDNPLHEIFKEMEFRSTEIELSILGDKLNGFYEDSLNEDIERLPPPIFESEIILKDIITLECSSLKHLSSGEKQILYTTQNVIYHLNNLNSVFKREEGIKYKKINLFFEEIELYFHPDYQRKFINYLREGIKNINISNIDTINMCFVTHSPFILSDIPASNCMFLEVDKKTGKAIQRKGAELNGLKTFGANIYDLLKNGFFMDSFIGEVARKEINNLFDLLNKKQKGGSYDSDNVKKRIELIGDVNIQQYLWQLLDEKDDEISFIEKQIKLLEDRKKELNDKTV